MKPRVAAEQIEFFSGHTYAQRPVAFTWEGRKYQVETILSEWKTPDGKIFLVCTTSDEEFELVYQDED